MWGDCDGCGPTHPRVGIRLGRVFAEPGHVDQVGIDLVVEATAQVIDGGEALRRSALPRSAMASALAMALRTAASFSVVK